MGRGRKTKFDPETKDNILRMLRAGVPICDACQAADVHETNFRRRLKRDSQFRSEVTRARARGKAGLIVQIAQDRDWRAKAWLLSRLYPSQFAETVARRLPLGEAAEQPRPLIQYVLGGTRKPISFAEVEKRFCNFPVAPEPDPDQDDDDEDGEGYRYFEKYGVVRTKPPSNDGETPMMNLPRPTTC
jgi:hypothetical protein